MWMGWGANGVIKLGGGYQTMQISFWQDNDDELVLVGWVTKTLFPKSKLDTEIEKILVLLDYYYD